LARHNIRVNQGATYKLDSTWREPLRDLLSGDAIKDEDGNVIFGPPIDMTGYTGRMQIRKSVHETEIMLELTNGDGVEIPAPTVRMLGWCVAASTSNLTLTGAQSVDGVALVAGDRVLVKNQTDPEDNGIYVVATGAWARASDADTAGELTENACVWVYLGLVNHSSVWRQEDVVASLTDPQTWVSREDVGLFHIIATDEQTATLTSSGVYDVELESAGGEVTRILEGKMRLSLEVTR
jgi:hypothetical protein